MPTTLRCPVFSIKIHAHSLRDWQKCDKQWECKKIRYQDPHQKLLGAETRPPIKFCGNPTNTQCFRVFFVFMQSDRARYSVSLCKVKPTGCSMYICSVFNRHIYQYCQHSHLTRCKKANNCFPKCQQFLLRKNTSPPRIKKWEHISKCQFH